MDTDNKTLQTPHSPAPVPQEPNNGHIVASQQSAAADIARSQINSIYDKNPGNPHLQTENNESTSPYNRTHTANTVPSPDAWKQYHSAWQNYYQQYYAGYYAHHLRQKSEQGSAYFKPENTITKDEQLTKDEALFELRQTLLTKVRSSAENVRKSRHFAPILSGLLVIVIFLFLQYNRLIFAGVAAYVSPGSINPQNIVLDPSKDIQVSDEPRLIIPKLNIDAPVIYGVGSDHDSQMKAMENGVAQFAIPGASSVPGQIGNTVLSGHSSNDLLDKGDYKFIFSRLDSLVAGDSMYVHYKGIRYTYTVTRKEVVKPTQVDKLIYPTTKPVITLITCTPIGTAINRLLITAEQTSPDPSTASPAPGQDTAADTVAIPGNSPTLWERLFGGSN